LRFIVDSHLLVRSVGREPTIQERLGGRSVNEGRDI